MSHAGEGGFFLVVDDDAALCDLLSEVLQRRGHRVEVRPSATAALDYLKGEAVDVVLADINMPGSSGIDLCRELHLLRPELPVVIMTAFGSLETAIEALRAGAYDFLTKPVDLDLLGLTLQRALERTRLQQRLQLLDAQVRSQGEIPGLIGESPLLLQVLDQVRRLAGIETSVLICGESGSGKELVARALHSQGGRKQGPFVALNCAALPETLLESELFGHVKGAFTDARQDRAGLFVEADGGTLLLDEVGELPLSLQPKLLRVLEERKIRPVGGSRERAIDVRIVAATHRDLDEAVAAGRFREDLYYRLNVVQLDVPPLRLRGNDVLLLARHFCAEFARRFGKQVEGLDEAAAARLLGYDWPGNIRELRNVMERAVALTEHNRLVSADLPPRLSQAGAAVAGPAPGEPVRTLAQVEQAYLSQVMQQVDGNRSLAAKLLGIDRKTLYRKLKQNDPLD